MKSQSKKNSQLTWAHIAVCESLVATHPRRWKSEIQRIHALASIATFLKETCKPQGVPSCQRPLLDKGIKYILQCCRSMFNYAVKRRHLSPYAENPFSSLDLDRIPVENSKPVVVFSDEQERDFLQACDDWHLPLFLTLILTGLRPGELVHLLPDDLDLETGMLYVRNKPQLGWQKSELFRYQLHK